MLLVYLKLSCASSRRYGIVHEFKYIMCFIKRLVCTWRSPYIARGFSTDNVKRTSILTFPPKATQRLHQYYSQSCRRKRVFNSTSQHTLIARMSSTVTTGLADEYRLPLNVKPTHYDVTIRTDLEKLTFDGFVKVKCVSCLCTDCT